MSCISYNQSDFMRLVNPLYPNKDEKKISLYIIISHVVQHSNDEHKGNNHQR